MAFFVLDENHNLIEAYDKEGVLAVLEQAIADGSLSAIVADSAFVSKLRCCVGGSTHRIAFVTQAIYNNLRVNGGILEDCYYFIIDDTTAEDINATLEDLAVSVDEHSKSIAGIIDGSQHVGYATSASDAGRAKRTRSLIYDILAPVDGAITVQDVGIYYIEAVVASSWMGGSTIVQGSICISNLNFQSTIKVELVDSIGLIYDGSTNKITVSSGTISNAYFVPIVVDY